VYDARQMTLPIAFPALPGQNGDPPIWRTRVPALRRLTGLILALSLIGLAACARAPDTRSVEQAVNDAVAGH